MAHINLHTRNGEKERYENISIPSEYSVMDILGWGKCYCFKGAVITCAFFIPTPSSHRIQAFFCNISFAGRNEGCFVYFGFFFLILFFGYLVNSFRYVFSGCVVESLYKRASQYDLRGVAGITKWAAKTPLLCIPFLPLYPHLDIEYSGCRSENWGEELSYSFRSSDITYYTPRALLSA